MPDPFIEPDGHKKPYRVGLLFAPDLIDPRMRRVYHGLLYAMFLLFATLMFITPGDGWRWALVYVLAGVPLSWAFVRFVDFMRRSMDPKAARLAMTADGRTLLEEGEGLHRRRERLMEDRGSPYPLLVEQIARRGIDAATVESCAEAYAAAWQDQLRFESDLRARQERHLRGEKVALVSRLSP